LKKKKRKEIKEKIKEKKKEKKRKEKKFEVLHCTNVIVAGIIQENKIHDQQKWLSAAIQARFTTPRQSPS
jgi:hypothetical protein